MFTTAIQPRFGDMDVLGHINNTVPAYWFETARSPVFEIFVPDLLIARETFPLILAHTDYDFVNEIQFKYEVEIRTWVSHIGTKSFTVYQEAWQEGRCCVKGCSVIVYYDFSKKQSSALPEDKKKLLAEHLMGTSKN